MKPLAFWSVVSCGDAQVRKPIEETLRQYKNKYQKTIALCYNHVLHLIIKIKQNTQ